MNNSRACAKPSLHEQCPARLSGGGTGDVGHPTGTGPFPAAGLECKMPRRVQHEYFDAAHFLANTPLLGSIKPLPLNRPNHKYDTRMNRSMRGRARPSAVRPFPACVQLERLVLVSGGPCPGRQDADERLRRVGGADLKGQRHVLVRGSWGLEHGRERGSSAESTKSCGTTARLSAAMHQTVSKNPTESDIFFGTHGVGGVWTRY